MSSFLDQPINKTVDRVTKGEISCEDLVNESLHAIDKWEPHINSFIEVLADESLKTAQAQDKAIGGQNNPGRLSCIPIAIKDVICTTEGHTTAASKILEKFYSPFDATVIKKLKEEGAIIVGKANLDEFAMGSSNEYSAFGPSRNPWDTTCVAGGSSGGPATAVASGEVPVSLGTDTGGSIRLPASFCGVVGLKPTYGRVSRFGLLAYASSFDQAGPFGRYVKDVALLLEIIAGQDKLDATTSPQPVDQYTSACGQSIKGLKIGIPKEFFSAGINEDVSKIIREAIKNIESLGAETKEISLPLTDTAIPTYYLLVKAEASSNLARYDSLRYGEVELKTKDLIDRYFESRGQYFGPEVKRSILMGTYALSTGYYDAWYKQASKVRTMIRQQFLDAFREVDIIAGPVAPETAFPIGSKADDPLKMYLSDALTVPISVAGLPALSVPCGFANNLPVGLQLIAPHFEESRLFKTAYAYEQSTNWHNQKPTLVPKK
jgi:aspartyl-tRNA(Asn)/glutamyl-tRNA(Gln) amidotransferase subunit A